MGNGKVDIEAMPVNNVVEGREVVIRERQDPRPARKSSKRYLSDSEREYLKEKRQSPSYSARQLVRECENIPTVEKNGFSLIDRALGRDELLRRKTSEVRRLKKRFEKYKRLMFLEGMAAGFESEREVDEMIDWENEDNIGLSEIYGLVKEVNPSLHRKYFATADRYILEVNNLRMLLRTTEYDF